MDHNKLWKILKETGIPDHLTCLLRNLYAVKKQQLEQDMEQQLLLLSHFSHVQVFKTPWTVAYQAPLSMGFSWQEYWDGFPFPSPMEQQTGST